MEDARHAYQSHISLARKVAAGIRLADAKAIRQGINAAERLYNSVLILNRVAEETDEATKSDEESQERVNAIRKSACAMLKLFADGKGVDDCELEQMGDALERARAAATGEPKEARRHVMKTALIFGLCEVIDGLRDLKHAADS